MAWWVAFALSPSVFQTEGEPVPKQRKKGILETREIRGISGMKELRDIYKGLTSELEVAESELEKLRDLDQEQIESPNGVGHSDFYDEAQRQSGYVRGLRRARFIIAVSIALKNLDDSIAEAK
jgi:hypothetical protein